MGDARLANTVEPEIVNQILSALSLEYNRCAVQYFRESSETIAPLDEVVEYVVSCDLCQCSDPEKIGILLHHVGLPKLAVAGVLDYDARSNTVRWWDHPLLEVDELTEVVGVV